MAALPLLTRGVQTMYGPQKKLVQVYGHSPAAIVGSNPTGERIFVCCECCVLSGRGLCDELITRPEESYRPWCVAVCDLEKPRE
jgi:hypothetical protein